MPIQTAGLRLGRVIGINYYVSGLGLILLLFPYIRSFGGAPYVALVLCSLLFIWLNQSFIGPRALYAIIFVGCLYILLSYLNLLPGGWTIYFYRAYILQQSSFVVGLPVLFAAASLFWSHLIRTHFRFSIPVLFLVCGSAAGLGLSMLDDPDANPLYAMQTPVSFLFVFSLLFAMRFGRVRLAIFAAVIGLPLAIFGESVQIKVIGLFSAFVFLFPWPRALTAALCLTFVLATVVGYAYLFEIWNVHPDTAIRLVFWHDALEAVYDTLGIGVGFGREAIKNYYPYLNDIHFDLGLYFRDFMLTGPHNSFVGVTYRLGVGGGIALAALYFAAFPIRSIPPELLRVCCVIFFVCFVDAYVNVGIESPTYLIGISFMLSLTYCMNTRYRAPTASRFASTSTQLSSLSTLTATALSKSSASND